MNPLAAPAIEQARRQQALEAAGRSCEIEGFPPPSIIAIALYERWIRGEIHSNEVIQQLVKYHSAV